MAEEKVFVLVRVRPIDVFQPSCVKVNDSASLTVYEGKRLADKSVKINVA